jgi:hypothetical protein
MKIYIFMDRLAKTEFLGWLGPGIFYHIKVVPLPPLYPPPAGDWNQGFLIGRQVLYHLSICPSLLSTLKIDDKYAEVPHRHDFFLLNFTTLWECRQVLCFPFYRWRNTVKVGIVACDVNCGQNCLLPPDLVLFCCGSEQFREPEKSALWSLCTKENFS